MPLTDTSDHWVLNPEPRCCIWHCTRHIKLLLLELCHFCSKARPAAPPLPLPVHTGLPPPNPTLLLYGCFYPQSFFTETITRNTFPRSKSEHIPSQWKPFPDFLLPPRLFTAVPRGWESRPLCPSPALCCISSSLPEPGLVARPFVSCPAALACAVPLPGPLLFFCISVV